MAGGTRGRFDTIAPHSTELHEALKIQWESNVNQSGVKLTSDQKYICKAMGTALSFLPFATEDERKQFALYIVDHVFPKNEDAAAI